ncbi:MAG: hypothetical protein ACYCXX_13600 [Acidiferrobacter thiooxydans]
MYQVINIAAGMFGIIGGVLWFLAATITPTPPIGSYFDVTDSPTSPFAKKWRTATLFNQLAATVTGCSALLFGLSAFIRH